MSGRLRRSIKRSRVSFHTRRITREFKRFQVVVIMAS